MQMNESTDDTMHMLTAFNARGCWMWTSLILWLVWCCLAGDKIRKFVRIKKVNSCFCFRESFLAMSWDRTDCVLPFARSACLKYDHFYQLHECARLSSYRVSNRALCWVIGFQQRKGSGGKRARFWVSHLLSSEKRAFEKRFFFFFCHYLVL